MTRECSRFSLLLWKDWRIMAAHPCALASSLIITIMGATFVVIARRLAEPRELGVVEYRVTYPTEFPSANQTGARAEVFTLAWFAKGDQAFRKEGRQVMQVYDGMGMKTKEFQTEEQFLKYLKTPGVMISESEKLTLCGIIFEASPSGKFCARDLKMTLRFPGMLRSYPGLWATDHIFTSDEDIREGLDPIKKTASLRTHRRFGKYIAIFRATIIHNITALQNCLKGHQYYAEGFITIQHITSLSIIKHCAVSQPLLAALALNIANRRYPENPHREDMLTPVFKNALPMIITISFLLPFASTVKAVTKEKECYLKETMKIMGLSNALHWSAWFIKTMVFLCVLIVCILIMWKVNLNDVAVFEYTEWSVLFFFFFIYAMASTCLAFMVSTLFSRANTAAVAGGLIWMFSYIPAVFIQKNYEKLGLEFKLIFSFLSNTAMVLGFEVLLNSELKGIGIRWDKLCVPLSPQDDLTLSHIFLMLLCDSVIYMVLALYIEAVLPGSLGMPLPWNFFFEREYWTLEEKIVEPAEVIELDPQNFEKDPEDLPIGVQLKDIRKVFPKNKVAVDNVTLNLYEGQITVLLGHNGAGKSTTIAMITGIYPPTSGSVTMYGRDVIKDTLAARETLSICLQQNVLFDELSVSDHLYYFCKLKGLSKKETKEEIEKYITLLALENKREAMSRMLSGGMKRKLAIGIALCGRSKVVLLDEPTAGVDPAARQDFWNVLRGVKNDRTILLTTHFMDEAEALGDRIAIMAEGRIVCCGSPFFLKKRYGSGYKLIVEKGPASKVASIRALLTRYVTLEKPPQDSLREVTFQLRDEDSPKFGNMFRDLEAKKKDLKIESFGVSVATMDDVFIKTVEESGQSELLSPEEISKTLSQKEMSPEMFTGVQLQKYRLRALCFKRWIALKSGWPIYLVHCFISAVFLIILEEMTRISRITLHNPPALEIDLKIYSGAHVTVAIAPENETSPISRMWYESYKTLAAKDSTLEDLGTMEAPEKSFEDFMLEKTKDKKNKELYPVSATWNSWRTTGWYGVYPIHAMPLTNLRLINSLLDYIDMSIILINFPVPPTDEMKDALLNPKHDPVARSLLLGMGFLCGYFILLPIKENACKSKHLQFVSGVDAVMFWGVHCLWSLVLFIIPCLVYIAALVAYQEELYSTAKGVECLVVLLICLGWSAINLILPFSYAFNIPATGYIMTSVVYPLGGVLFLLIDGIQQIYDYDALEYVHIIFLFLPSYNLPVCMKNMKENYKYIKQCERRKEYCDTLEEDSCCPGKCPKTGCYKYSENYWDLKKPGIGINIIIFLVTGLFWFGFICLFEYLQVCRVRGRSKESVTPEESDSESVQEIDDDVKEEKNLIHSLPEDELREKYTLCLKDVTKWYKKFLAVDSTCIGVKKGECFGLLGANGAGKTTTFRIMTGDLQMSYGKVYVLGSDISKNMRKVCQHIGYCPQFDALLDNMTGRETLYMFCLIRGIHRESIPPIIENLSEVMLFSEHLDKKLKAYSGGARRKVSMAVALVGRPPLVFLDEPTAGMDPVARRCVWGVLRAIRDSGVSIVFTSHSMNECEELCTRIAIMVNGQFRCLGSLQHLKNKFAEGHVLQIRIKQDRSGQKTLDDRVSKVTQFIQSQFPGSTLRDEYLGLLTFLIPKSNLQYSDIFGVIEKGKNDLLIEEYILSQSNLEQVFQTFVKDQG